MAKPAKEKETTSEADSLSAKRQAQGGKQPRGKRFPEVVQEFARTSKISVEKPRWDSLKLEQGDKIEENKAKILGIQGPAKVLDVNVIEGGVGRVDVKVGTYHTVSS